MSTVEKIRELKKNGYVKHHTAYGSRYVSCKTDGYLEEYEGRFGKGYKWFLPCIDSTRHCYISYYVKEV